MYISKNIRLKKTKNVLGFVPFEEKTNKITLLSLRLSVCPSRAFNSRTLHDFLKTFFYIYLKNKYGRLYRNAYYYTKGNENS